MFWNQTLAPTTEPLSVTEAKEQVGFDGDGLNTWFHTAIAAAREQVETDTGLQLITATWTLKMDYGFPVKKILLDKPPVATTDVSSIQYIDEDGTTQTWAASKYTVSKGHVKTRIVPVWGEAWPNTRPVVDAVTVTFTAGYGAASVVPSIIKKGMKLLIGHWFLNRENTTDVPTHLIANGYSACVMSKGVLEIV